jgi:hypothetical protein
MADENKNAAGGGAGVTNYSQATASVFIGEPNVVLRCRAQNQTGANGANVSSFTDLSGNDRHLVCASSQPTLQTNVLNGKSVVRWTGAQNPLAVTFAAPVTVFTGYIVARFTGGATFSNYSGLLTDKLAPVAGGAPILVGDPNTDKFFNVNLQCFEYRFNERIFAQTSMIAPMSGNWAVIFFRFWRGLSLAGVQLGQDRDFANRKWTGDVAEIALYDRLFSEDEARAKSAEIAAYYGLTLADVYPYQADRDGITESFVQAINVYDPPEGSRISEVLSDPKKVLELRFSVADQQEIETMKRYHAQRYAAAQPCIYRDYRFTPPQDIEAYFDAPYELSGSKNNFSYTLKMRER